MADGPAIQDAYPEDVSHCYGCGRLNEIGHQIKTRPDDDGTVTEFTPEPFHTAVPGYAYGGVVASIIDCHSTGSASIFAMQRDGKKVGADPSPRFVTGPCSSPGDWSNSRAVGPSSRPTFRWMEL